MAFEHQMDRDWFKQRMDKAGLSLRAMAKRIPMDPGALSRTLRAERRMQLPEVRRIAEILGASEQEVMTHASVSKPMSSKQEPLQERRDANRHPAWGIWSGRVMVKPDYDYTQPAETEWGALNEKD
jgi:transcriptional regulator with XRE-family HTH domain